MHRLADSNSSYIQFVQGFYFVAWLALQKRLAANQEAEFDGGKSITVIDRESGNIYLEGESGEPFFTIARPAQVEPGNFGPIDLAAGLFFLGVAVSTWAGAI